MVNEFKHCQGVDTLTKCPNVRLCQITTVKSLMSDTVPGNKALMY